MISQRHDLVYLNNDVIPMSFSCRHAEALYFEWIDKGYPFIITQQYGVIPSCIKIGLPYFDEKNQTKYRYAFEVNESQIKSVTKLPGILDVFPKIKLPKFMPKTYVYGSYAWQHITGMNYITSMSDVDILIEYNNETLLQISNFINDFQKEIPSRMDGEIRFTNIGDCSVLEFLDSNASEAIFKNINRAELIKKEVLFHDFPLLSE